MKPGGLGALSPPVQGGGPGSTPWDPHGQEQAEASCPLCAEKDGGGPHSPSPPYLQTGLSSPLSSPCAVREDVSGGSLPPDRLPFPGTLSGATLAGAPWALSLPLTALPAPGAWVEHCALCDSVSPAVKWKRKGLDGHPRTKAPTWL